MTSPCTASGKVSILHFVAIKQQLVREEQSWAILFLFSRFLIDCWK
jgi:hypothetical protein